MTYITIEKEKVMLALEVLERVNTLDDYGDILSPKLANLVVDTIDVLKESLAQSQSGVKQEQRSDSEHTGEPVARVTKHVIPLREEIMLYCDKHLEIGTPLYLHSQRNGDSPCARHCEANAFEIEIKNLKGDIERAILAEREACLKICEEQAVTAYWEGADVCVEEIKKRGLKV